MSYYSEVIADTPVAYWRLGEASGNPQDSVGTNHVTSVVGTPIYGVTGALAGDGDKAITFNAVTPDRLSVPDATAVDLGDVFSIEFWFKRASIGAQYVISKGATGGDTALVYFAADNHIRLAAWSTGTPVFEVNLAITDTASWHHTVLTKNGATRAAYYDGVDYTALSANVTLGNSTNALLIEAAGGLDEVAFYNYALTSARVLAHYRAGVAQPARLDYSGFPKFPLRRVA